MIEEMDFRGQGKGSRVQLVAAAVSKPEGSSMAEAWADVGCVMDVKQTGFADGSEKLGIKDDSFFFWPK